MLCQAVPNWSKMMDACHWHRAFKRISRQLSCPERSTMSAFAAPSKPLPRFVLQRVIISYPKLFTPAQFQGEGPAWYSAAFLINPRTQARQLEGLTAACEAAAQNEWPRGEWKEKRRLGNPKLFWWPIRDGEEKADKTGYKGMVFIQA